MDSLSSLSMEQNLKDLNASQMFSNAARKSSFDFVNVFKVIYLLMQVIRPIRPKNIKKLTITTKFKHNILIKKLHASKVDNETKREIKSAINIQIQ